MPSALAQDTAGDGWAGQPAAYTESNHLYIPQVTVAFNYLKILHSC
jgi:hypothetical protein